MKRREGSRLRMFSPFLPPNTMPSYHDGDTNSGDNSNSSGDHEINNPGTHPRRGASSLFLLVIVLFAFVSKLKHLLSVAQLFGSKQFDLQGGINEYRRSLSLKTEPTSITIDQTSDLMMEIVESTDNKTKTTEVEYGGNRNGISTSPTQPLHKKMMREHPQRAKINKDVDRDESKGNRSVTIQSSSSNITSFRVHKEQGKKNYTLNKILPSSRASARKNMTGHPRKAKISSKTNYPSNAYGNAASSNQGILEGFHRNRNKFAVSILGGAMSSAASKKRNKGRNDDKILNLKTPFPNLTTGGLISKYPQHDTILAANDEKAEAPPALTQQQQNNNNNNNNNSHPPQNKKNKDNITTKVKPYLSGDVTAARRGDIQLRKLKKKKKKKQEQTNLYHQTQVTKTGIQSATTNRIARNYLNSQNATVGSWTEPLALANNSTEILLPLTKRNTANIENRQTVKGDETRYHRSGQGFQRKRGKFSVSILRGTNTDWTSRDVTAHPRKTAGKVAVFYNVFVPLNKTNDELQTAFAVIREQIGQIGSSVRSPSTVTLNIVNIGQWGTVEEDLIRDICSEYKHMQCIQKRHYEKGFEDLTLAELYDHCQENGRDQVVYMHNKGSFHGQLQGGWSYINQDVWRRMGTMAAASDMCLTPLKDNVCDFCGLIATPMPWLHVPGNFWGAQCSYIQKLLHPREYERAMHRYREEVAEPYVNNGTMKMIFTIPGKRCFGDERWAAENWIGSHPSVRPCDLANVSDIKHWQTIDRNSSEFSFSFAPRQNIEYMMSKSLPRIPPRVLKKPSLRFRDYHFLGGMISRWMRFYGVGPHPSSWVWSYYPDAQAWQDGLNKYGKNAFEMVSAKYQQ